MYHRSNHARRNHAPTDFGTPDPKGRSGPPIRAAPVAVGMQALGWPIGIRTNKTSNRRRFDRIQDPKPWLTTSALAAARTPLRTCGVNPPFAKRVRARPGRDLGSLPRGTGERL